MHTRGHYGGALLGAGQVMSHRSAANGVTQMPQELNGDSKNLEKAKALIYVGDHVSCHHI